MRRNRGNELIVAVAVLGILAFALTFGIILSLSNTVAVTPTNTSGEATRVVRADSPSPTPTNTVVEPSAAPAITATTAVSPTRTVILILPAATATSAPTQTRTATPTETAMQVPTETFTPTATTTATSTGMAVAVVPSMTENQTPTITPTPTPTPTVTATAAVTATPPPTLTMSPTATPTSTTTLTASPTATLTSTTTPTASPTATPTSTASPTLSMAAPRDSGILPTPTPFATRVTANCVIPPGWESYTVKRGNTLFAIALAVDSTVGELRDANCLENVDTLYAGTRLYVPRLPAEPIPQSGSVVYVPGIGNLSAQGCIDSSTRVTNPPPGATINDVFTVFGTAFVENLAYYKLEIRPDFAPTYNFYDRFNAPVVEGALGQVNPGLFDDGLYWLRLTVVDTTGNFPPPCDIPLFFQSGSR